MPDDEPDMIDGYPRGPNGLHDLCRDEIVKIDAALANSPTKAEAKNLRSRRNTCRMMMNWCKTRAGYVKPGKATSNVG